MVALVIYVSEPTYILLVPLADMLIHSLLSSVLAFIGLLTAIICSITSLAIESRFRIQHWKYLSMRKLLAGRMCVNLPSSHKCRD